MRVNVRFLTLAGLAFVSGAGLLIAEDQPANSNKPEAVKTDSGKPAAEKDKKFVSKGMAKLSYDPKAEKKELFAAMEAGMVDARLVPKGAMAGTVFFTNKTKEPITIQLPEAVVGVPSFAQFGQPGGQQGGFGGGGLGQQGGLGGGGQNQNVGGGFGGGQQGGLGGGGGGLGGGMQGGGGAGFFSIPPEKVVSLQLTSVCLNHGRPEPTTAHSYKLVKPEDYSKDKDLHEVLAMVGTGKLDPKSAQAATWHLTDRMSFEQLAYKGLENGFGNTYFTADQLMMAQNILSVAKGQAIEKQAAREKAEKEKAKGQPATPVSPSTSTSPRVSLK